MPIRGRQVTSSDVCARECQLELWEVGRLGQRRRSLERRDRPGVVAEPGPQRADRRPQLDHVRMAERQGRRIMIDRVAVREEPGDPIAGLLERLGRLGISPGIPLVLRDLDQPAEVVATGAAEVHPQRLCDASVQEAATSQAGRLIDEVAQRAMGEVVSDLGIRRAGHLADECPVHQFVDGLDDLVLGPAAGVSDGRKIERAPDGGSGCKELVGGAGDRSEPLPEHGPHAVGHPGVGDVASRQGLHDVERQALRRRHQRVDSRWRRRPDTGRGGDEPADVRAVEAIELDHRRGGISLDLPGERESLVVEFLESPGQQQHERTPGEPSSEVRERIQRCRVDPLEVVEPEEARWRSCNACGQPVGDRGDEPCLRARTVGSTGAGRRLDGREQSVELGAYSRIEGADPRRRRGIGQGGPEQLDDRAVGDRALRGVGASRNDDATVLANSVGERLREPRLADPGFAGEDDDPTDIGGHRANRREARQRVVSAHEGERPWARDGHRFADDGPIRPDHGCVADRLVPGGGLIERGDAQLAFERRHADPILAERGGPIPVRCEQVHEPDVGRLIEWVQVDAAHGRGDRAGKVAGALQGRREMVEDGCDRPLGRYRAPGTPVVEVGAVAEGKSRQERAAGEAGAAGEVPGQGRASQTLDVLEVDPHGRAHEIDLGAIDAQGTLADRRPERRQRPTERTPGSSVIGIGPEQGRELVAGIRPLVGREHEEDRHRLARVDDDGDAVHEDLRWTQQVDVEIGCRTTHRVTVPISTVIP